MRKFWLIPLMTLLLTGCSGQQTYETVSDYCDVPTVSVRYTLSIQLPKEASRPVMDTGREQLYECGDYSVVVQMLEGGDLSETLQDVTGMDGNSLTIMETLRDDNPCYQCVWTSAGEDAQRICRTLIMDDGAMHHAVTVIADHALAGNLAQEWEDIFSSAKLISTG